MTWTGRTAPIQVGDHVAYSASFLRSISCFTGHLPQARGIVTALQTLNPEVILAEVDWNDDDVPKKVNVKNLSRVKGKGFTHD